jgi:hypothetical protein
MKRLFILFGCGLVLSACADHPAQTANTAEPAVYSCTMKPSSGRSGDVVYHIGGPLVGEQIKDCHLASQAELDAAQVVVRNGRFEFR